MRCSNTVFCVYLRKLLRNSGKFYRLRQNKTVFMLNIAQYYTIFMSNIAQYQKIYLNFGPILFRKHKKLQYYISSLWHLKKPKSGLTIFRYNPKSTLFIAYWYSYTICKGIKDFLTYKIIVYFSHSLAQAAFYANKIPPFNLNIYGDLYSTQKVNLGMLDIPIDTN